MIGSPAVETLAHSVLRGERAVAFFNDDWDAVARANPRAYKQFQYRSEPL